MRRAYGRILGRSHCEKQSDVAVDAALRLGGEGLLPHLLSCLGLGRRRTRKFLPNFAKLLQRYWWKLYRECKNSIKRCQNLTEAGLALTSEPVSSGTLFRESVQQQIERSRRPLTQWLQ